MASKKALNNRLVAKVVDGESGPCAFCRQTINDEISFGKLYSIGDLYCHYFCVLFSCCLVQKGQDEQGLLGFLYSDLKAELERSKKHKCSYCGLDGANLGCAVTKCRKQFHLPCGRQRESISLFYGNYKSFCSKHAPRQKIASGILEKIKQRMQKANKQDQLALAPEEEDAEVCVICYEPVPAGVSSQTFWPPCCARDARFHRHCLQRMAVSAGIHYLKCPLCNDKNNFYKAVLAQGYYVPDRDAAWELEQNAFAEIYNREISCDAEECKCPMGRNHDENGQWDIKPCLLCGSCGIHSACLPGEAGRYVCPACLPAAPADLDQLEAKILEIQEQQQRTQAAIQPPRRLMPSRMSLKGKGAALSTTSFHTAVVSQNNEDNEPQSNTLTSRQQLNLKPPRRATRLPDVCTDPYTRTIDIDNTLSPLRYLQEKLATVQVTVDSEKVAEKLRVRFKKPRPMSHKRKIMNAIFNEIVREGSKTRSPLKEWNSPKKLDTTPQKKENQHVTAKAKSPKKPQLEHENTKSNTPEHETSKTPIKTPNGKKLGEKTQKIYTPEYLDNTAKRETIKTPIKTPRGKNSSEKSPKITPEDDESSNSTFQLPSEFVADHNSDDDLPIFDTPKKCTTVVIEKDSSMEISNDEAKINIDLIKIESQEKTSKILKNVYVKSPNKTVTCSYKFSLADKEVLQNTDVGIDVESFKSKYLNEVVKDSKPCSFSHNNKHDCKEFGTNVLKTPIDFALEAVKKVLNAKDNNVGMEEVKIGEGEKEEERSGKRTKAEKRRTRRKLSRNINEEHNTYKETAKTFDVRTEKSIKRMKHSKKRGQKGSVCVKKEKSRNKEGRKSIETEIVVNTNSAGVKRKLTDLDSEVCEKKPKLELDLNPAKRNKVKVKRNINRGGKCKEIVTNKEMSYQSGGDDFETKKRINKPPKNKLRSKEEKRLRKLKKKKDKKKEKCLLKYNKNKGSVKIKFVYKGNDAFDEDTIDLTVHSKKNKKSAKKKYSGKEKEINLNIKFNTEQRKSKTHAISPSSLKQTVLNFSPENCSSNSVILKPQHELVLKKKKQNIKKEFVTDSLKQTSIQNFFFKIEFP